MTKEDEASKERNQEVCEYIEASTVLQSKDLIKSIGE